MKILIDLQSCQSGSRLGGIGRYSLCLAKSMIRQAGKHDIWLLLNNNLPEPILSIRKEFIDLLPQNRIITFESIDRVNEFYTKGSFRTRAAELLREDFIARLSPDFVLVSSLFEGLGDDVVTSIGNIPRSHFTAVILYDLIPFIYNDIYLSGEIEKTHYMRKIDSLKRSDLLLAISEFSRGEGERIFDFPTQRAISISSGISDYFRPLELSKTDKDDIRAKFTIKKDFLMYTSSFDPRKNQGMLIEAFSLLPAHFRNKFQLILVGNKEDNSYNSLKSQMRLLGLEESDVIFTGYIDDETMLKLYNMCHLFVFPSLFEGFGLPILEAMSCGTPAIGSNSTSIPEVIGREDALFDPESARSISSKIFEVLRDRNFYESLCQHALSHSKKFSWDNSAKKAIGAMQDFILSSSSPYIRSEWTLPRVGLEIDSDYRPQLINQVAFISGVEGESDGTLLEISAAIATNDYFLELIKTIEEHERHWQDNEYVGVVTTWNTKCGIAAYAKHLMSKFIGNYCIFAPYTDELIEPDESFVSRCWHSGVISDSDVFLNLSKEIDNKKVTSIFIQLNYDLYNYEALSIFIENQLNKNISVFVELHCLIDHFNNDRINKLAILAPSLKRCNKLMVHTHNNIEILHSLGINNNIVLFPMGVLDISGTKYKHSGVEKDIVISTYGYFLPHKGYLEMIEAFAELSSNNSYMKLLMVNAESSKIESRNQIEKALDLIVDLGLTDKVTLITDYLPESQCLEYLKKSDLIVFPYQHGNKSTSTAVRFGLLSEVPVAVTPLTIFHDVNECVCYLPGASVKEIAAGIKSILYEIKKGGPNINRNKDHIKYWLISHNLSDISNLLYLIILSDRAFNGDYRWGQYFSANDQSLQTIIGELNGFSISSSGSEGLLLYGPYITLAPGIYDIRCFGNVVCHDAEEGYELNLVHSGGKYKIIFDNVDIDNTKGGLLFYKRFTIEQKVENFEVKIIAKKNHNLIIDAYIISRNRFKH